MPIQKWVSDATQNHLGWRAWTPDDSMHMFRGFRYGDGIFESILLTEKDLRHIHYHAQRLQKGIDMLGLNVGNSSAQVLLDTAISQIWDKKKSQIARLRFQIARDADGLYGPKSNDVTILAELESLARHPWEDPAEQKGLTLGMVQGIVLVESALSILKTSSALPYVYAKMQATAQGWDDGILRSQDGSLAECTSSNIFIRRAATLITPPLKSGCLPGTLRQRVIESADLMGMDHREQRIVEKDLFEADEVFLTNAISGIRSVRQLDKTSYDPTERIFAAHMHTHLVA